MNNALNQLQPYPFEKLRALLGSVTPNPDKRPIALSIGEPKHTSPAFVAEALSNNLDQMAVYPTTLGIPALREAIGAWCERRFNVPKGWLDPARNILPVNGTREALCAFTQTVVNRGDDALVVSPNPRYLETLPDPVPVLPREPDRCADSSRHTEKTHRPGR